MIDVENEGFIDEKKLKAWYESMGMLEDEQITNNDIKELIQSSDSSNDGNFLFTKQLRLKPKRKFFQ